MPIPPKPHRFEPYLAPGNVEVNLGAYRTKAGNVWWSSRPTIQPRLQLVHTNGATKEGSIESAINWGNANPDANTHPHYQVDRHRACKLVPTDRKAIGNKTIVSARGDKGDVADWSLVIETADEGYPIPGQAGGFIGDQVETIAQILAYEAIVHGIPLIYPLTWWGPGTACHTEPFTYPFWTNAPGKVCPGATKKIQMRTVVLPRAREIFAAWTAPPLPSPNPPVPGPPSTAEVDDMLVVALDSNGTAWVGNGINRLRINSDAVFQRYILVHGKRLVNTSGQVVTGWENVGTADNETLAALGFA